MGGPWKVLESREGDQGEAGQRRRWLVSITNSVNLSLSKFWVTVKDRGAWDAAVHWVAKSWTQPSDWTTTGWEDQMQLGGRMNTPAAEWEWRERGRIQAGGRFRRLLRSRSYEDDEALYYTLLKIPSITSHILQMAFKDFYNWALTWSLSAGKGFCYSSNSHSLLLALPGIPFPCQLFLIFWF